jgi:hypothetical protein
VTESKNYEISVDSISREKGTKPIRGRFFITDEVATDILQKKAPLEHFKINLLTGQITRNFE